MQDGKKVKGSQIKLRDALFECLKDKALSDVTIKEVCERAGLNRVTFYRNYKTLNEIVSEVEQERLEQLHTLFSSGEKHGEDLIREAITILYEAKEVDVYEGIENLFKDFKTEAIRMIKSNVMNGCISLFSKVSPLNVELALELFISGVLHIIANNRNKYDCEDIIKMILTIRNDAVQKYS